MTQDPQVQSSETESESATTQPATAPSDAAGLEQDCSRHNWPQRFQLAHEAYLRGETAPLVTRFPIVIAADKFISSAQQVQSILGLPSVPEVITTTQVGPIDWPTVEPTMGNKFQVCAVDYDQRVAIEKAMDEQGTQREWIRVFFEGGPMLVYTVRPRVDHSPAGDDEAV